MFFFQINLITNKSFPKILRQQIAPNKTKIQSLHRESLKNPIQDCPDLGLVASLTSSLKGIFTVINTDSAGTKCGSELRAARRWQTSSMDKQ